MPSPPALAFIAFGLAASTAALLVPSAPARTVLAAVVALAAAAAVLVGARRRRPADAWPWWLFAAGLGCFAAGELRLGGGLDGTPSGADLLALAGYACLSAGLLLLLLARPGARRRDPAAPIDAAIVTIAAGTLAWVFLMDPYTEAPDLALATRLVALAYPVAGLLLLAVATQIGLVGGGEPLAPRWLGVGLGALIVADVLAGLARLSTTVAVATVAGSGIGGAADAFRLLAFVAFGAAALDRAEPRAPSVHPAAARLSPVRVALLIGAVLVGPVLLVAQELGRLALDDLIVLGGTALVSLLVVARVGGLGRRLEGSVARYRALVEQTPAIVYAFANTRGAAAGVFDGGADGAVEPDRLSYVSPRVTDVLGYAVAAVEAPRFLAEHIHPEDAAAVGTARARSLADGSPFSASYRLRAGDGRWVWVQDDARLVREGVGNGIETGMGAGVGTNGQWQGVLVDVSAAKEAEEAMRRALDAAEEADRAKSRFLSTAAHELRTPLTTVAGYADLLLAGAAGDVGGEQREFLEIVRSNAARLTALVTDLLDLSRIEAGRLHPDLEPVDLGGAIEEVRRLFGAEAAAKGIALAVTLPAELPAAAADRSRLQQVMTNLVGNAVRFTEQGGVEISARARDGWVEVAVADTGIGIAPELLPHVFEEFGPATALTRRRYGGTGLGLSISRRLVELQHGTIGVESTPGIGSTFTLRLPVADGGSEDGVRAAAAS